MKSNFGKKGWGIILFTLLIYMFSSTVPDSLNVTTEGFAARFGMESGSPLLIFAAVGGFVGIPLALIVGHIIARKGVKGPGAVLMFIMAVLWLLNGQCRTFPQYAVVLTAISAFANVANLVVTQQLMSNWFPKKKGLALGWATIGLPLDSAVMVAVFQVMIARLGLAAPYFLMTGIMAVLGLVMLLGIKAYPEEAGAFPDNEPVSEAEQAEHLKLLAGYQSDFTARRLLGSKAFWLLVLTFGFLFIGLIGAMSQMVPRLTSIHMTAESAILWLMIASLVGIPASVVWGAVDQKCGTKITVVIFSILWTIMMLLSAVGCGLSNVPVTIVSLILLSLLQGGLGNLMPSMIISVYGRYDFAQANKLIVPFVVGIRTLAFLLFPIVLGMAGVGNEAVGYRNVFLIFTVLALLAVIASLGLPKKTIGRQ